jgi:transposase InsO family protein
LLLPISPTDITLGSHERSHLPAVSRGGIKAIVEMKQRNPRYGCPRIAKQINLAFGLELDKDIVRRVLAVHYKPDPSNRGPSWLTTLGHAKDSLWSRDAGPFDLFRAESTTFMSHWIMVVMDQYTRRITGLTVHAGDVDGQALCQMFNHATAGTEWPKRISTDNDPLYRYHQWKANLRILDIEEIESLPHVPMSQPFLERLIGSIRWDVLDQTLFWTATDPENKLGPIRPATTSIGVTPAGTALPRLFPKLAMSLISEITAGRSIVVACFSYR